MRRCRLLPLVVAAFVCLAVAAPGLAQELAEVPAEPTTEVVRLAGGDRIDTAVAMSQMGWETSTVAVLARADDPADALGGTVLAGSLDAPLLLSARDRLPSTVGAELRRLGVEEVRLLGGEQALAEDVATDVRSLGAEEVRRGGPDRHATAVAVAHAIGETSEAYLVPGQARTTAEAVDALAAGPIAAVRGVPLLPAPPGPLPDPLTGHLRATQPRVREIGPVFADYGSILQGQSSVETLLGDDRYETARALFGEWASEGLPTAGTVLLGDGRRAADLLAAGALAARLRAPLLLVDGIDPSASPTTYAALASIRSDLDQLLVIGGAAAVSEEVVAAALRPEEQIAEPPGGQIATHPQGSDPRTLEDQRLETSAYLLAAPSQTDLDAGHFVQVTLRNTGTTSFLKGYTGGSCSRPPTTTSVLWDGRRWRPGPYTYRDIDIPPDCPADAPIPLPLKPGREAAFPFTTRAPGVYRIDHVASGLGLSVTVEVLGCRSCASNGAEG